jgi:cysteinyl-tRNA synthetase
LRLLFDMDRILGFGLKAYLQSEQPRHNIEPEAYLAAVPGPIAAQVRTRTGLRQQQNYQQADDVRQSLLGSGYQVRDTRLGTLVAPRRLDEEFPVIAHSSDAPDATQQPDRFTFSINLLAHNSKDDLERCIKSICRNIGKQEAEIVVIDNGSTDETLPYLQQLARQPELRGEEGQAIGLQVLFADHNMGFAAGRNATMRASRGQFILLMDTSIEVTGDIWTPLQTVLSDTAIGIAGPYGLRTEDLREFQEAEGPDVDAIEGYLLAFRRELLPEVGWIDEKFRFYRLMDIYYSFFFKAAGYRAVTVAEISEGIEKHPHREWYSLSEEERRTKSKKNYDIFRDRWHHGENLLVTNYEEKNLWRGHDHPYHIEGTHTHAIEELPPNGEMHSHTHRHWPDHSHEHPHYHSKG